jgi:hypothetical protein
MALCYMLQYMDKVTLGYATQLNLRQDLVSETLIWMCGRMSANSTD